MAIPAAASRSRSAATARDTVSAAAGRRPSPSRKIRTAGLGPHAAGPKPVPRTPRTVVAISPIVVTPAAALSARPRRNAASAPAPASLPASRACRSATTRVIHAGRPPLVSSGCESSENSRWVWAFTSPGSTIASSRSMVWPAGPGGARRPTAAIRPRSITSQALSSGGPAIVTSQRQRSVRRSAVITVMVASPSGSSRRSGRLEACPMTRRAVTVSGHGEVTASGSGMNPARAA